MASKTVRVVARITAKPDKIAEVSALLRGLVGPTRKEKGCIGYELLHNNSDRGDFTFVEEWSSDSAFDAHLSTPHVQEALSKAESFLAKDPEILRYSVLA